MEERTAGAVLVDVCKVVKKKERPFRTEDYSPQVPITVWYHEGTGSSVTRGSTTTSN